jgi:hypothetical protein
MKRATVWLGLAFLAALSAPACGDDDKEPARCSTDADCETGSSCLWLHAENRLGCARPCNADADCAPGRCAPDAASCQTCQDIVRICR